MMAVRGRRAEKWYSDGETSTSDGPTMAVRGRRAEKRSSDGEISTSNIVRCNGLMT
jgi:hypothetical protein